MRKVKILVSGTPVGQQHTWAYPHGESLGDYIVPVYCCTVQGVDDHGKAVLTKFNVLRFGVQSQDGKTASVVGLADYQTHTIKAWLPYYRVHSARSQEDGAWQVYGNFLIHDGPDNPRELFASIGCIEIMGYHGFVRFNDLIIALSGASAPSRSQQLSEIGRAGCMSITYEKASRPPLIKAP